MDTLVSIVVPSYKRDNKMVGRAIHSLLSQTYKNIEVILVDDNAKEEHKAFREGLMELVNNINDDRLIYVQNEKNLGGSGARNVGIEKSKGEYVTFLDDDDEYLPEKVEKQLAFMLENELDVSFGKLNIYNEEDKLTDVRDHKILSFDKDSLQRYHIVKQITGTPTFMVKKTLLQKVGGFDIVPMGQEFYLMNKLIGLDCKIGYYPDCYIKAYRTSAEAISTGKGKIAGEKQLYKFKKQYFSNLSFKEKQYVRCRHYAVMAVTYKRNKKYFKAIFNLVIATLCSPLVAIKEAIGLTNRINKGKTHE